MTKEEYITLYKNIQEPIVEKYGSFLYFLINDIVSVRNMETICEKYGFTTERVVEPRCVYSKLFYNSKLIGCISTNQGSPSIEFNKRCRKYSRMLIGCEEIIEPIEGIHRILEWHDVEGKLHKLAGGQTILHFKPFEITEDEMIRFLTKTNLLDKVDKLK